MRSPSRPRTRWIALAALLALAGLLAFFGTRPSREVAPAPSDPESAWKALGMKGSPDDFARRVAGLRSVRLDRPPVVGADYHPAFPPDVPFDPRKGGWKTAKPSPSVADPKARRGGTLHLSIQDYPPTIRTDGPDARLKSLTDIQQLVYEPLLAYDMALGGYVPNLADSWWIGKDRQTFRFHIDPKARWSDGTPVTSDDVVATFEHLQRADRKDPETAQHWHEQLGHVKIVDRHIVEVHARKPYWRTFLEVSGQNLYPAAYIRMAGDTYLNDWNWRLPPGTGPYALAPGDLVKGQSITVRRRHGYWDEAKADRKGTYNFEAVRWDVIRDEELTYQKFLAGELDAYMIMRAQRWVDDLEREHKIQMGWIQRRKIYTLEPQGYGGFAFNLRTAPFNDGNVRQAFTRLFNRELMFAKFFFYQYEYMDSYFPGQEYARPDHAPLPFDAEKVRALLAQSGWEQRDDEGFLVNKDGERFPTLELNNSSPTFDRIFAVVQNDLWEQAGIKMEIVHIDAPSLLKKVWDNQFQLVYWIWTAQIFPDMEFQFGSKYADIPQSNNFIGFKNAAADAIFEKYKYEFDQKKRIALMQQLDALLFGQHPYALSWYGPYYRIIYWDKFGHPPEYGDRYVGDLNNIIRYWWIDPQREKATHDGEAADRPNYPDKPGHQEDAVEQRYWLNHPLPMRVGK